MIKTILLILFFPVVVCAQDPMYRTLEKKKSSAQQSTERSDNSQINKAQNNITQNTSLNKLNQLKLELESNISDLQEQLDAINKQIYEIESAQGYSDYPASDYSNCETIIMPYTDKMDGVSYKINSEDIVVSEDGGNTGFSISMITHQNKRGPLILNIKTGGAGSCIDANGRAQILFRDGSRLDLYHKGSFNCDAEFTVYFGGLYGSKKPLRDLGSKEVETLRVWTSDGYVERDFSIDNSLHFMNTIQCLSSNL